MFWKFVNFSHEKIVLKKWNIIYKDHITLQDYEVHDGFNFELYYRWMIIQKGLYFHLYFVYSACIFTFLVKKFFSPVI